MHSLWGLKSRPFFCLWTIRRTIQKLKTHFGALMTSERHLVASHHSFSHQRLAHCGDELKRGIAGRNGASPGRFCTRTLFSWYPETEYNMPSPRRHGVERRRRRFQHYYRRPGDMPGDATSCGIATPANCRLLSATHIPTIIFSDFEGPEKKIVEGKLKERKSDLTRRELSAAEKPAAAGVNEQTWRHRPGGAMPA